MEWSTRLKRDEMVFLTFSLTATTKTKLEKLDFTYKVCGEEELKLLIPLENIIFYQFEVHETIELAPMFGSEPNFCKVNKF